MSVRIDQILSLSVEERLNLIEEIWDSISANPETIPLTPAQTAELDRRKTERLNDPGAAKPWSEIHERLSKRSK
jgi:putative addiction module component (TIGR02574 family)